MIKNIVFDLGNVLIRFEPRKYLLNFCEGEVLERVYKVIFESHEWRMLDRGTITEEEAIERFCRVSEEDSHIIKKAMNNWHDILVPIDDTVKILKKLKEKGFKLYVLSNYHKKAFEWTIKKNEFFNLFDGMVISCDINFIKPERQIYEHLLNKFNLDPKETIFIDDLDENLEGAKELGINTIKFNDARRLIEDLKNFNINLD